MARRRITQIFPWLLPLRKKQRKFCFYLKMRFDGISYAEEQSENLLPHMLFSSSCPMLNPNTGFDMVYQENKVHNLRLAAKKLDKLIIKPGETFSFWKLVRYADKEIPYKDGLAEIDGKLTTQKGGGLCQISNLLFWLFLHTPLTIIERRGHVVKDFPESDSDAIPGVDATVSEGWIDLRVRNDTDSAFQISLTIGEKNITGGIFIEKESEVSYEVSNKNSRYYRENNEVFEKTEVYRACLDSENRLLEEKLLYTNICQIRYEIPEDKITSEKG